MALLAKICAATSRCAARPSATAGSSRRGARGSASTDVPSVESCAMSSRVNGTPHFPTPASAVRSAPGLRDRDTGHEAQMHRLAPGVKFHRRRRQGARRQQRARSASASGSRHQVEDFRQPGDVDRLGGNQRIRQRERGVAGRARHDRAEWQPSLSGCSTTPGSTPPSPAPSRPTTMASGSANTVTSSADPVGSRRVAPRRVERAPEVARHADRRCAGEDSVELGARPVQQSGRAAARNSRVERIGLLRRSRPPARAPASV